MYQEPYCGFHCNKPLTNNVINNVCDELVKTWLFNDFYSMLLSILKFERPLNNYNEN